MGESLICGQRVERDVLQEFIKGLFKKGSEQIGPK